jgi:hypothetical protein
LFTTLELVEHLIGWNKKRIGFQGAAYEYHRVRSHDVHRDAGTEPGQIVGSADRVVVLRQNVVEPRFVFDEILHAGPVADS